MTPYEINVVMSGYAERQKERQREIIFQSWITANWSKSKKMPALDKMLKSVDAKPKKQQKKPSQDELIEIAKRKGLKGPW